MKKSETILFKAKQKLINGSQYDREEEKPKKESIFSTKYEVPILAERKTIGTARGSQIGQLAPKLNGNVQQTKPYCTLI